ncbi:unnamed protein product [Oreochromis niloticus]|nr:unnamed protein product [Mustela putorius furo]
MLHGLPLSTDTPGPRQRAVMPATPAKVPKYNGLTPLEPYLSQVRLAARHSGWSDEEAATHLVLALEGDALQDLELVHDFWLADIQDQCIIGLDLLTRWGACVDTAKLAITLGTETLALQCGQKQGTRDCRQTRLVQHTIDTGSAQPICLRPRQLPLSKRQGERAQEARGVATARATAGGGGWLSLTMQQLKQEQEADATLVQVGAWLEVAQRPGWTGVSGQGPEVKAYYSQYNNLETHGGLLNRRVSVAGDCSRRLRERPRVVHEYTHQAQVSAAVRQKRACDTRCRGGASVPGDKVWVYCPVRKRGVSPRLCGHWQGPAEVVGRLTEVVYQIRMPGPGRVAVLHLDRLSPYRPPAPAAAGAGDAGGTPGSHPSDSSPAGRDRPARRRKTHGHLQDFVWGNGVVGDD